MAAKPDSDLFEYLEIETGERKERRIFLDHKDFQDPARPTTLIRKGGIQKIAQYGCANVKERSFPLGKNSRAPYRMIGGDRTHIRTRQEFRGICSVRRLAPSLPPMSFGAAVNVLYPISSLVSSWSEKEITAAELDECEDTRQEILDELQNLEESLLWEGAACGDKHTLFQLETPTMRQDLLSRLPPDFLEYDRDDFLGAGSKGKDLKMGFTDLVLIRGLDGTTKNSAQHISTVAHATQEIKWVSVTDAGLKSVERTVVASDKKRKAEEEASMEIPKRAKRFEERCMKSPPYDKTMSGIPPRDIRHQPFGWSSQVREKWSIMSPPAPKTANPFSGGFSSESNPFSLNQQTTGNPFATNRSITGNPFATNRSTSGLNPLAAVFKPKKDQNEENKSMDIT